MPSETSPRSSGPQLPIDVHSQYGGFKDPELTPWLSDVPSQILRNGVTRWRDAMDRFRQGLSKAPTHRNRYTFNTVTVSSELFRFVETTHPTTQKRTTFIELGTQAHPIGLLKFKAHRPFAGPKTLCIRVEGLNIWHVSFCYEHALTQVNDQGVQDEVITVRHSKLRLDALVSGTSNGGQALWMCALRSSKDDRRLLEMRRL